MKSTCSSDMQAVSAMKSNKGLMKPSLKRSNTAVQAVSTMEFASAMKSDKGLMKPSLKRSTTAGPSINYTTESCKPITPVDSSQTRIISSEYFTTTVFGGINSDEITFKIIVPENFLNNGKIPRPIIEVSNSYETELFNNKWPSFSSSWDEMPDGSFQCTKVPVKWTIFMAMANKENAYKLNGAYPITMRHEFAHECFNVLTFSKDPSAGQFMKKYELLYKDLVDKNDINSIQIWNAFSIRTSSLVPDKSDSREDDLQQRRRQINNLVEYVNSTLPDQNAHLFVQRGSPIPRDEKGRIFTDHEDTFGPLKNYFKSAEETIQWVRNFQTWLHSNKSDILEKPFSKRQPEGVEEYLIDQVIDDFCEACSM